MEVNAQSAIKATLVSERDRPHFLPKKLPNGFYIKGEQFIYQWMGLLSPDYNGGYWEFYALSNGGFYMAPTHSEPLKIRVEGNGFQEKVSPDTAGIVATLFGLNTLACQTKNQEVTERYYQLRDFALNHPDRSLILAAID
jgi:hypothetical protein